MSVAPASGPEHDARLAVLRIAVFTAIAVESMVPGNDAAWFAGVPAALRSPLAGYPDWLMGVVVSPAVATGAQIVTRVAAALAAAGVAFRVTSWLAVGGALLSLGLPHFYDAPDHGFYHHHHLIWLGLLLCVSPAAARWSLARGEGRGALTSGTACDAAAWAIAAVYFFPGLWKLLQADGAWISGESMRLSLWDRWWELGGAPVPADLVTSAALMSAAGVAVVALEIGVAAGFVLRRTRVCAAAAALAFHLGTAVVMRISFWPLVICLFAFFDWHAVAARLGLRERARALQPGGNRKLGLGVAAGVLLGAVAAGAARIESWPFACYPRFDRRFQGERLGVRVERMSADGAFAAVDVSDVARRYGRVRWQSLMQRAAEHPEAAVRQAIFRDVASLLPRAAGTLRFIAERHSTDPGLRAANPIAAAVVAEISL